jgi:hypothetical protein
MLQAEAINHGETEGEGPFAMGFSQGKRNNKPNPPTNNLDNTRDLGNDNGGTFTRTSYDYPQGKEISFSCGYFPFANSSQLPLIP